jgi:(1->4)-alpha-D-glucan 1-alpha-D-glucosylmutase
MAIAPRLTATLNGWGDTAIEIPAGAWRNRLTGDAVSGGAARIEDLLVRFPVALLTRETGTSQPNPSS